MVLASLLKFTDAGKDEPEAEGNDDGHPTKNNVFKNKIWSDAKEVIRMTNSDGNDIYVSKTGHSHEYLRVDILCDIVPEGLNQKTVILAVSRCHTRVAAHISTCLLYTSPSPRDGLLSRMPSSA